MLVSFLKSQKSYFFLVAFGIFFEIEICKNLPDIIDSVPAWGCYLAGGIPILLAVILGLMNFMGVHFIGNQLNIFNKFAVCLDTPLILSQIVYGFAIIYLKLGLLEGGTLVKQMTTALYFSVITITTTGYGDIIPTPQARPFVCIEALSSFFILGLLFTILTKLADATKKL